MPYKCCVVGCSSGKNKCFSQGKNDISLHKFPLADKELLNKWTQRISRQSFTPTKFSRVCSLHFEKDDFEDKRKDQDTKRRNKRGCLSRRLLRPNAIPSKFPTMPSYFTSTQHRRGDNATASSRRLVQNERFLRLAETMFQEEQVSSLSELKEKLQDTLLGDFFLVHKNDIITIFQLKLQEDECPEVVNSLTILQSMEFKLFKSKNLVPPSKYSHIAKDKIMNITEVKNLMAFVSATHDESLIDQDCFINSAVYYLTRYIESGIDDDKTKIIEFIKEQLMLTRYEAKGRRYSAEILILCYILFSSSPSGYHALLQQNILCLPSIRTLRKITWNKGKEHNIEKYLKLRAAKLNNFDMNVIMVIDEIYVAKKVEYSGGEFQGLTSDDQIAQTALCFMIKSLSSKYRDLVGIFPIRSLRAAKQHECFLDVLSIVHKIGFQVVAVVCDNSTANRKFFIQHLCNGSFQHFVANPITGEKMFLLFDPTHNLKNLYNNFQKRKIFSCPPIPPYLERNTIANFNDINMVYHMELDKPLKIAYKLNRSVIQPSSMDKLSMKLACAAFHESTVEALRFYNFHDTANIINLFMKVWNVMNVRTTSIGRHKRDTSRDPVRSSSDWKLCFLEEFTDFLSRWNANEKESKTYTHLFDHVSYTSI